MDALYVAQGLEPIGRVKDKKTQTHPAELPHSATSRDELSLLEPEVGKHTSRLLVKGAAEHTQAVDLKRELCVVVLGGRWLASLFLWLYGDRARVLNSNKVAFT